MPDGRSKAELVERLEELARRRQRQMGEADQLAADIRLTVREAQVAGVPTAEIARRLALDRSTLYRTYLGDNDAVH